MNDQSENINELAAALSKAQGEIEGATKDSTNPFFKSKFADLSSVMECLKKAFTKNGLSYTQPTRVTENGGVIVVTKLMHSSGQWIKGEYPAKPVKDDPQGLGAALTYSRRYALSAICGVAQIDDDGESAMARSQTNYPKPAGYVK